ncbi:MAG TPA: hypothetical protein VJ761_17565 [Ktedonobacteraceae bacterium]|nr:hypothetical protein [Ktedonobacteraceae bacterium]
MNGGRGQIDRAQGGGIVGHAGPALGAINLAPTPSLSLRSPSSLSEIQKSVTERGLHL